MKYISMIIALFFSVIIHAQTYLVQGKVADIHNLAPLSHSVIYLNNKKIAETDSEGKFSFSIKKGNYKFTFTHADCHSKTEEVLVNKDVYVEAFLEHHEQELEHVVLTGHQKVFSSTITVKSLGKEEIQRNSSQNLGNILSNISGINTLKTGNNITKPVIHGLYGSRILIMNNSVKMAEQEWGVEHAPSVDANAFETLNVVKGAGTLKYGGDAMGGVVMMEPKQFPARDTIMGDVSATYNSNGKGGNVVANLAKTWENKWYVRAQGAYKKLGDLSTPKVSLQNTGTIENSFSFGVGNRSFNQGVEFYYSGIYQNFGIYKGSHLGSAEDFLNAINTGQMYYTGNFSYKIDNPKQEVSHHLVKIEAYKRVSKWGKFTGQYSFQLNNRKEYDIRKGEYNLLPSMDLRLITHQVKLENLLERENWKLETGVSGALQDNYPNPETKARRLIPDYYRYDGGIFSVFEYKFNPKITTEIGARYDYNFYDAYKYYDESEWDMRFAQQFPQYFVKNAGSRVLTRPQIGFHNFSGNVGVNFNPNEHFNVKLNLARASRTPNAAELFADGLHHSAAIIERGNLAINQEVIYQANLSAKANFNILKGLNLEVNPYFMTSENFINQNPSGAMLTIRGVFPVWDYQQIKARMYGLDADAELKFTDNIKWNGQFSTVYGDDLTNHEPLILMVPTNFRNALELNFPRFNEAFLKVENIAFLKQNRFPVRHIAVDVIENGQNVQKTLDLSSTPSGYSFWNIAAGINLTKHLRTDFGVTNLTNVTYREYLNRLRYFADALGRNYYLSLIFKF